MNASTESHGSVLHETGTPRGRSVSTPPYDFYVVGVGASADGTESLVELFERMPADSGMAFLVMHGEAPAEPNQLDTLLSSKSQIPFRVATNDLLLEPNHVYLCPPRHAMAVADGHIRLTDASPDRGDWSAVDHFFHSLAQSAGRFAIGVALVGSCGSDSPGLRAIHEAGGLVIAHCATTAAQKDVQQPAEKPNYVDLELSPPFIPEAIVKYVRKLSRRDNLSKPPPPHIAASDQSLNGPVESLEAEYRRARENLQALADSLAESEIRVRKVVESAMDAVIAMDDQGLVIRWNPKAEKMFHYPAEEAIGRPLADLVIPPEQREAHRVGLKTFLETGKSRILDKRLELVAQRRNGQRFPVELTVAANQIGERYEFSAFIREITQRRRAERRLSAEHAISQVLLTAPDLESAAPQVLSAFCRTLDVDVCELWLPAHLPDRLACVHLHTTLTGPAADAYREATLTLQPVAGQCLIGNVFQRREPLWSTNIARDKTFLRADAALKAGLTTVYAFPIMLHREVLGVVCFGTREDLPPNVALLEMMLAIGHDLGQFVRRSRFERELAEARKAAEAANEAKSAFLANMSHEIRTPMTSVVGLTELLLSSETDPSRIEMLRMIQRSSHHLVELINDILDLSKIESGKLAVDRIDCSPVELVQDLASVMSVRAREKQLSFEVVFESPLPRTIYTDPMRLRQILINLIGNAIKFTNRGKVRIVTRYLPATSPPRIEFEVADTGIGMNQEELARLFEPFSQIDHSVTRRFGGTGLGLCISQRLAHALDGEVFVESEPGVGSTFRMQIAAGSIDPQSLVDAQPGEVVRPELSSRELRLDCHALVAEDTRGIQYLIKRFLEDAGATVSLASNGQEAIDVLREKQASSEPVEVVIMDMHMPILSGYDAVKRLRQQGVQVPIIALTARAMQGDREKCLSVGCDDYLPKPVDRRHLLDAVARQLSSSNGELAGS